VINRKFEGFYAVGFQGKLLLFFLFNLDPSLLRIFVVFFFWISSLFKLVFFLVYLKSYQPGDYVLIVLVVFLVLFLFVLVVIIKAP
jgi:hypothetical protein